MTQGEHFNSQPHEEADKGYYMAKMYEGISTHSLTRRLTTSLNDCDIFFIFQLTASRGG